MLEGYGIHTIIWDSADERLGDFMVASPADATGRGLELHVRQGGAAANLTGAKVYFLWRHKRTGKRGCEPMAAIDASLGQYLVYYPSAMQEAEGAVEGQCMVSWNDRSISTRVFTIRVEPVLIGGTESEDGFTLFVETIKRYEGAVAISTASADAAYEAAEAANDAADAATAVADAIQQAAQRGDFDGADGKDGFSPIATIAQTADGATITITDRNGTTSANVSKGVKGDKGDPGETGPQGPKGDTGEPGPPGPAGGTVFTPQPPLALNNGVLSVDLSGITPSSDVHPRLWVIQSYDCVPETRTETIDAESLGITDIAVGDWVLHTIQWTLSIVTAVNGPSSVTLRGILDFGYLQGIVETTDLNLAQGEFGSATAPYLRHRIRSGTLLLNSASGALMQATRDCNVSSDGSVTLYGTGLGKILGGGASYTASSPLSIDSGNVISIDLSSYATKQYVDDAIAAIANLEEEGF